MVHTVIVPGVGGSDKTHWQSWLENQLQHRTRVQQQNWNKPILKQWVKELIKVLEATDDQIQIVAHSFGCLTSLAALNEAPELAQKVKKLILVAPANPKRFGANGFATDSIGDYQSYFYGLKAPVPTTMLISEDDPWFAFDEVNALAAAWKIKPINLGKVGHINVASGFGPFPEIFNYIISEKKHAVINKPDIKKLFFKFAF
ncbi:alpha/beta hydrolase [Acinetobacter sp. P8-3-8]|uniref:RBBP9/YdeN family alpha/beta hydrolase n=1 Tax=Acinetobacter sp. P8-3-8 TaxID=1029823 RepID=UPI0002485997|nr:alpha/beta hydrolase [Acinetobacter sp. P8-3-8]